MEQAPSVHTVTTHSSRKRADSLTAKSAFVWNFLVAFDRSYLVECFDVWRQAAVDTENAFVDDLHGIAANTNIASRLKLPAANHDIDVHWEPAVGDKSVSQPTRPTQPSIPLWSVIVVDDNHPYNAQHRRHSKQSFLFSPIDSLLSISEALLMVLCIMCVWIAIIFLKFYFSFYCLQ